MSTTLYRGGREVKPSRWSRLYQKRREELLDLLGRQCRHCGSTENLSFDHIRPAEWPRNRYSSHERLRLYILEARSGNIQTLCTRCNSRKNNRVEQQPIPLYANLP